MPWPPRAKKKRQLGYVDCGLENILIAREEAEERRQRLLRLRQQITDAEWLALRKFVLEERR